MLVVGSCALSVSLATWIGKRLPSPGQRGRLIWIVLITVGAILLPIGVTLASLDSLMTIGSISFSPEPVVLGVIMLWFAMLRGAILVRRQTAPGLLVGASATIRQSAVFIARVLLIVYLAVMVAQIPFRDYLTPRMHAQMVNEVQSVEDWYQQYEGGGEQNSY